MKLAKFCGHSDRLRQVLRHRRAGLLGRASAQSTGDPAMIIQDAGGLVAHRQVQGAYPVYMDAFPPDRVMDVFQTCRDEKLLMEVVVELGKKIQILGGDILLQPHQPVERGMKFRPGGMCQTGRDLTLDGASQEVGLPGLLAVDQGDAGARLRLNRDQPLFLQLK